MIFNSQNVGVSIGAIVTAVCTVVIIPLVTILVVKYAPLVKLGEAKEVLIYMPIPKMDEAVVSVSPDCGIALIQGLCRVKFVWIVDPLSAAHVIPFFIPEQSYLLPVTLIQFFSYIQDYIGKTFRLFWFYIFNSITRSDVGWNIRWI